MALIMKEIIIQLRSGRKGVIRPNHPWIYKGQYLQPLSPIRGGSIVTVWASDKKFLGRGYFNANSEIAVRIMTFIDEPIDDVFIDRKIAEAAAKRAALKDKTNAYRAVFSEADSLPGLIIDVYGATAVFQILTLGMEPFIPVIVEAIKKHIGSRYIYEKSDGPFRKQESLKIAQTWHGGKGNRFNEITEGKARFVIDIYEGHKTGFYLDQRSSRVAMQAISKGKTVLDLFTYVGGFAIHAALGGASHVTAVDIKEDWLELGKKSAQLNGVENVIEFIRANSFTYLKTAFETGKKFDIIIVDPPSFLKTKSSLVSASKGYKELNYMAMRCLADGGVLATFSCSHNMPNATFSALLKEAAVKAGKNLAILKRCHQAEDHPIVRAIPETEYLKGYFFKVNPLAEDAREEKTV